MADNNQTANSDDKSTIGKSAAPMNIDASVVKISERASIAQEMRWGEWAHEMYGPNFPVPDIYDLDIDLDR